MINSHKWLKLTRICLVSLILLGFTSQVSWGEDKVNNHFLDYSFSIPEFSLIPQSSSSFFLQLQSPNPFPEEKQMNNSRPKLNAKKPSSIQEAPNPETLFKPYLKAEKIENTFFTSSLITLSLLNLADFITTNKALRYEGLEEGNPILRPVVKNKAAFALIKAGLTYFNYKLLKKVHRQNKTVGWVLSALSNAVMGYVVWHNLKMIEKAQSR